MDKDKSTLVCILGVVSLVSFLFSSLIGIGCGIAAIVIRKKLTEGTNKNNVKVGYTLGIIGLILSIIKIVFLVVVMILLFSKINYTFKNISDFNFKNFISEVKDVIEGNVEDLNTPKEIKKENIVLDDNTLKVISDYQTKISDLQIKINELTSKMTIEDDNKEKMNIQKEILKINSEIRELAKRIKELNGEEDN